MTYEELKINLDLYDPEDVLKSVGRRRHSEWFVVCDEGDCHLFREDGTEDDIRKVNIIANGMIHKDIKKIVIPNSVTYIGSSAFEGCRGLANVTIPDSVTSIESWAFCCCNGLTDVAIPDSVTSMGSRAFYDCDNITRVTIGNSVTSIGEGAFYGCISLMSIMIPDSVTSIGNWAFVVCNKLKSLVFKGKTMDEVKSMMYYPWGIKDKSIITCCLS